MTQAEESLRISSNWRATTAERPLAILGSLAPAAMAVLRSAANDLNVGIAQVGRNGQASAVLDREMPLAAQNSSMVLDLGGGLSLFLLPTSFIPSHPLKTVSLA